MGYLVTLNLGKGSLEEGFASVTAQLWRPGEATPIQRVAALPPAPEIAENYRRWRQFYTTLYNGMGWRRSPTRSTTKPASTQQFRHNFDIDEDDITVISRTDFAQFCETLQEQFNGWLSNPSFRKLDQLLRTHLHPTDDIRLVVTADTESALRLPWHLWDFLEDYPQGELALSPANYGRPFPTPSTTPRRKVRILAILGDRQGIDTEADQQFLNQLPQSDITFLVEPDRATVSEQLWQGPWDILFFAGHSSSQEQSHLQINPRDRLSMDQIKYGLQAAINNGLKLAIFNSCDGLGLAQDLAELHLPQIIVMREPVPDRVAQEFLKAFLAAFAGGRSLYASVRQARERLQSWADEFPCASWLPVICQNPAAVPPLWRDWCRKPALPLRRPKRAEILALLLSGVVATGAIALTRWLGFLQPLELAAFDQLMRHRPAELPDPRLLLVTVTEADIHAEGAAIRQGSLSDGTLARLLQTLEASDPQVIGLDIYRDFPANANLAPYLGSSRLVAICKRPDSQDDPTGILPPPEVEPARLGFSDFVQDMDGIVRRQLLFTSPNSASTCATPYAFSVQLAFRYFHSQGMTPQFTSDKALQLGDVIFHSLRSHGGGYQGIDARGSQILLNYRATPTLAAVAKSVTVAQVLQGTVPDDLIRDRIVLIGVDTPSTGDRWMTPYGRQLAPAGVIVQAQMTSQLLSAVLDGRPLLAAWHPILEVVWIGGWTLLGAGVAWGVRRPGWQGGAIAVLIMLGIGGCFLLLLRGYWVPCVPILIALPLGFVAYRWQIRASGALASGATLPRSPDLR